MPSSRRGILSLAAVAAGFLVVVGVLFVFREVRPLAEISLAALIVILTLIDPRYGCFIYVVLLHLTPESTGRAILPEVRTDEFLLVLLLCVAFARTSLIERRVPFYPTPVTVPYLVYVGACVVSLFANATIFNVDLDFSDFYTPVKDLLKLALFMLSASLLSSTRSTRSLARLLMGIGFALAALALLEFFNVGGFAPALRSIYTTRKDIAFTVANLARVSATFRNPNFFALYMSFIVVFALTCIIRRVRIFPPSILVLTVVFGIVATLFAVSRSGLLALILGILVTLYRERTIGLSIFAVLLLAGLVVGVAFDPGIFLSGRWEPRFFAESIQTRWDIFLYDQHSLLVSPVLGYGAVRLTPFTEDEFHFTALRYGLVGFIPFCWLLWRYFRTTGLAQRTAPDPVAAATASALRTFFFVACVAAFSTPFFYGERISELIWLLLGALVGASLRASHEGEVGAR